MSTLAKVLVPCLAIAFLYLMTNYGQDSSTAVATESGRSKQTTMPCFRAAVYEHIPIGEFEKHTPRQILDLNLDQFLKAIKLAYAENVQLLVFPEDSLINSEDYNRTMLIGEILESMPNPAKTGPVNLCDRATEEEYDEHGHRSGQHRSILKTISCQAKKYRMFISLGFGDRVACDPKEDSQCPDDGNYLYNTIGLFDWDGNFVAKYHKMHLYNESQYDPPQESVAHGDPVVYYDSPFGRLGFMLCYDLLFRLPGVELVEKHHIDTMIYPTYWFDYQPFLASVQMQQAFGITHRINFIAACVQILDSASIGSGIFSGEQGAVIYSHNPDGRAKLIIATIPSDSKQKDGQERCPADTKMVTVRQETPKPLEGLLQFNASQAKLIALNPSLTQDYLNWCCPYSGVCCRLFYRVNNLAHFGRERFVMMVGNATAQALGMAKYQIREQYCALVKCDDHECTRFSTKSETEFEFVNLAARFGDNSHVYPSVLTEDLQLISTNQWKFSKTSQNDNNRRYTIVVRNPEQKIVSVGLYGRDYDKDPEYKQQKYV